MSNATFCVKDPWPVGRTFLDRPYTLTAQRVQEAIVAVGAQDNDWYAADASHYERPICPAGILSFQPGLFPDWERFGTRQAFNSRTEWTFFRPMWQGETLTLGMRISDRWLKRGKEHLTFYMSARDAEGKLVAECRFTETVLAPPEYEPPLICRDSEVSETRATNLAPELGTLSRTYTVEMSKALCGGLVDWHTDVKLAQERGFAQPVLLGAQIVCQACELLTRSYGTGFLEGGQISLNVLKPVMVGETIVARMAQRGRSEEAGGMQRIHLAIWCTNQQGEKAAAGTASANVV